MKNIIRLLHAVITATAGPYLQWCLSPPSPPPAHSHKHGSQAWEWLLVVSFPVKISLAKNYTWLLSTSIPQPTPSALQPASTLARWASVPFVGSPEIKWTRWWTAPNKLISVILNIKTVNQSKLPCLSSSVFILRYLIMTNKKATNLSKKTNNARSVCRPLSCMLEWMARERTPDACIQTVQYYKPASRTHEIIWGNAGVQMCFISIYP